MTRTIYYLKATDEDTLWTALETANVAYKEYDPDDPLNQRPSDLDPDASWQPSGAYTWVSKTSMLDLIGTIFVYTGPVDPDTGQPTPVPLDNFFYANLEDGVDIPELTADEVAALPTIDEPADAYRKWAGDE